MAKLQARSLRHHRLRRNTQTLNPSQNSNPNTDAGSGNVAKLDRSAISEETWDKLRESRFV